MHHLVGCMFVLCCVLPLLVAAQQRKFSLSASPSDMKVDGHGRVFLAAGNQLLRLDSTLALQENVTLGSSVLRVALSSDEKRVVVCLSDMSCAVYNASDFGAGEQSTREGASASPDVVALFTAEENSFYVGSTVSGALRSMHLRQYGFGDRDFVRSRNYPIQQNTFMRTLFGGFVNGTNSYYFMADGNPRDVRGLRVLRACDISTCSSPCTFNALYELRIDCGGSPHPQNAVVCGLSVLDSFAGSSDTTVVLARCNAAGVSARNRVCSYRLADIDLEMNRKYTECAGGTGNIQVSWDSAGSLGLRSCTGFQVITTLLCVWVLGYYGDVLFVVHCVVVWACSSLHETGISLQTQSVCDFNLPLGNINDNLGGSVQLEFGDTQITTSVAITVDSTSVIYVGYTNGSGNFVGAVRIELNLLKVL